MHTVDLHLSWIEPGRKKRRDLFFICRKTIPHYWHRGYVREIDMGTILRRTSMIICILAAVSVCTIPVMAQSSGALTITGDELVDQGRYAEAITYYDLALALEPRNAVALCGKGTALNELGKYSDALDVLNQAIDISPAYARAWYEKGNALNGLGQYEDAITAYDEALRIKPEYGYLAYYGKANALSGLKEYPEAIPLYNKALSLEPRYAIGWLKLGDALAATGDYQGAIDAYDQALQIEPGYTAAQVARDAAEEQVSGITTVPSTSSGPTRTTAQVTTFQTSTPTSRRRGIPLPLWICIGGIITAAYLVKRRT
jgi:tetratricopeptide (TPR) repeat protein